jgi:hypothetical protein
MELGAVCLYVLVRRVGLGISASLLLTAFCVTSANIVNEPTGLWSQRASVFLIPPVVLLLSASRGMPPGALRLIAAALAGFLTALLLTQDFYTAVFAALVAGLIVPGLVLARAHEAWFAAGVSRVRLIALSERRWLGAVGVGASLGCGIFIWVYLASILEHSTFPENHLWEHLHRPSLDWHSPLASVRDLIPYFSVRTIALTLLVALLALIPSFAVDRTRRLQLIWLAVVSVVVVALPLRFGDVSVWRETLGWLPGLGAIRDPKRIVYVYEVAAVLGLAVVLAGVAPRSAFRRIVWCLVAALLIYDWNDRVFEYRRARREFERWVERPIAVESSCRSFFIKNASAAYRARSDNLDSLSGADALFIALRHGVPTLNGYSAWVPPEYPMLHLYDADYLGQRESLDSSEPVE